MRPAELVRLQVLLEFRLRGDDRLEPVGEAEPGSVPRISVVRHDEGFGVFTGPTLDPTVRARIDGFDPSDLFADPEVVQRALGEPTTLPFVRRRHYWFPTSPEVSASQGVARHDSLFVDLVEGAPVSWAWTVREHGRAAEASVETVPDHRRRGHAARVLSAWVGDTIKRGRLAMLTVDPEDPGAGALANRIGGIAFADSARYP